MLTGFLRPQLPPVLAMSRLVGFLFVFPFFAFGIFLVGYGAYSIYQSHQAATWPTVRGEIEECKLHSRKGSYNCQVRYTYKVGSQMHHGTRIAFGYSGTNNKDFHEQVKQQLSKSRYVQVHYSPRDSSESVLSTGIGRQAWLPVVFGLTWLTIWGGIVALCICDNSVRQITAKLAEINRPSSL